MGAPEVPPKHSPMAPPQKEKPLWGRGLGLGEQQSHSQQ
jgi:hypothetical protein